MDKTDFRRLLPSNLQDINEDIIENKIRYQILQLHSNLQTNDAIFYESLTIDDESYIAITSITATLQSWFSFNFLSVNNTLSENQRIVVSCQLTMHDNDHLLIASKYAKTMENWFIHIYPRFNKQFHIEHIIDDVYNITLISDNTDSLSCNYEHCSGDKWYWVESKNEHVTGLQINNFYHKRIKYCHDDRTTELQCTSVNFVIRNNKMNFFLSIDGKSLLCKKISFEFAKTIAKAFNYTYLREHIVKNYKPVFKFAHKID